MTLCGTTCDNSNVFTGHLISDQDFGACRSRRGTRIPSLRVFYLGI